MSAERIRRAFGRGFDGERKALIGKDAVLLILKTDGGAQTYSTAETVTGEWAPEFSDLFGSTTFKVARLDAAFAAKVSESSFVLVINSDNPALNNQLHAINRETTRPAGADPYWRIRAEATGKRYTPA